MINNSITARAGDADLAGVRKAIEDHFAGLLDRIDRYDAAMFAPVAPGVDVAEVRQNLAEQRHDVVAAIGRLAGNLSTYVEMLGTAE